VVCLADSRGELVKGGRVAEKIRKHVLQTIATAVGKEMLQGDSKLLVERVIRQKMG
jgi:hypothetical protein